MALFFIPILAILFVSAIVLFLFRCWKTAIAVVVAMFALNWCMQVFPLHLFGDTDNTTDETFRIVTYNIYPLADSTEYDQWQQQMLATIKQLHPDILCLQEFSRSFKWLEKELRDYYSYTDEMIAERKVIKYYIYSRFPITNICRYKYIEELDTTYIPISFKRTRKNQHKRQNLYSANVHLPNGETVTVFCCHLQSNAYSTIRRNMDKDESWFDGIEQYKEAIQYAKRIRSLEAKNIRNVLDSIGNKHPILIVGDMNDFNQSKSLRMIQGDNLYDAWWKGGNGFGFTYSGFSLLLRLDHILFNNKLCLKKIEVGNIKLSDHRPLIADFSINSTNK